LSSLRIDPAHNTVDVMLLWARASANHEAHKFCHAMSAEFALTRRWMLRGAIAACAGRRAFAQEPYPSRPVRIIVPSTPGGPYDLIPRFVADYVDRKYGWTVVVENRPGASGIIGEVAAKQAPPDGYTLVVTTSATHGSAPAFNHDLPYDPTDDFAPIILLARGALVLLVRRQTQVSSVKELLALIASRPGRLKFSSGGRLSQQHLAVVMLLWRAGLPQDSCIHVAYRGLPEALTALLSGEVDFMIVSTGLAGPYIEKGDLRALAITAPARSARLPNVPTFAEIGYPGYQIIAWCGLAAPARTPQPILDRWNTVTNEALADSATAKRIDALDYDVAGGSAASFAAFFARDIEAYKKLAAATGLREE
jgi:tripartite-type tricarboxylate transporter receptor subunit TctC